MSAHLEAVRAALHSWWCGTIDNMEFFHTALEALEAAEEQEKNRLYDLVVELEGWRGRSVPGLSYHEGYLACRDDVLERLEKPL